MILAFPRRPKSMCDTNLHPTVRPELRDSGGVWRLSKARVCCMANPLAGMTVEAPSIQLFPCPMHFRKALGS